MGSEVFSGVETAVRQQAEVTFGGGREADARAQAGLSIAKSVSMVCCSVN
jgi:hypothetical protein